MEHLLQVNDQRSEQNDWINSGIDNALNLGSWDPDNIWWYNLKSRGTQYPVKTGDKLLDHVYYTYPVNTDQYLFRDTKYYSGSGPTTTFKVGLSPKYVYCPWETEYHSYVFVHALIRYRIN